MLQRNDNSDGSRIVAAPSYIACFATEVTDIVGALTEYTIFSGVLSNSRPEVRFEEAMHHRKSRALISSNPVSGHQDQTPTGTG